MIQSRRWREGRTGDRDADHRVECDCPRPTELPPPVSPMSHHEGCAYRVAYEGLKAKVCF